MIYADYMYYKDTYKGTMPEDDFNRLSRQATAYLNRITFNRAKSASAEEIKDACCAVADVMFQQPKGRELLSETVGPHSKQFAASGKSYEQKLYEAAEMYLIMTGLLYCGGGI